MGEGGGREGGEKERGGKGIEGKRESERFLSCIT